jgi:hypothetical protein
MHRRASNSLMPLVYDDRLRDIVNKTPFKMERRKKLSGNYKVFLET